jgi:HlyD family secretion protein
MANPKKRRKVVVFSLILLVIAGLAGVAFIKKREVTFTIQTEKVTRRNLTELVRANGKIQPVIQVKISPEVSGEIISLPVKEGQQVTKGDLIVKIKPDNYIAARNQAEAGYKSALAGKLTAEANLRKLEAEFQRIDGLVKTHLVSESAFDEARAAYDVAKAQLSSAGHQADSSKAMLARAEDDLSKTTIVSPITGTISKLNSEVGERVVGTAMMAGSDIMTIADLNEMEARVDIGEVDVVLMACGQTVRLEVDAFKDRKFSGSVTQIANSSKTAGSMQQSTSQEATKFEVRIRIKEKEQFRPGMSVTAEIETRSRLNVLTVPIASVTTRLPKKDKKAGKGSSDTNSEVKVELTASAAGSEGTNSVSGKKSKEGPKPIEVVFLMENDRVKMVPVKIGISDDDYWEITEGVKEGQEVVSGGYRAISRDLEDGKKVRKGQPGDKEKKEGEEKKTESS